MPNPLTIREADLATAPVGLYSVVNDDGSPVESIRDYYDFEEDAEVKNARCELLARVDETGALPQAVAFAGYREDGKRLVKAWVPKVDAVSI